MPSYPNGAKQRAVNVDCANNAVTMRNGKKSPIIESESGGLTLMLLQMDSARVEGDITKRNDFQSDSTYFHNTDQNGTIDYNYNGTNPIAHNGILEHAKDNGFNYIGNNFNSVLESGDKSNRSSVIYGMALFHGSSETRLEKNSAGSIWTGAMGIRGPSSKPSNEGDHSGSINYHKFGETPE